MDLQDAEYLAGDLIAEHLNDHLKTGERPWDFAFDRAVRRFGCCHWRTRRITLSRHLVLLNDEEQVRDVVLHEVAHALAGHRAGHGPEWRRMARVVGARPERCYPATVATPPRPWTATCPSCSRTWEHYRRAEGMACARCSWRHDGGSYDPGSVLRWERTEASERATA